MIRAILGFLVPFFVLVALANAEEVYVDVPVTVNVSGGCFLTTPAYSSTSPGIFQSSANYRLLEDYNIQYRCSSGMAFNLVFNPGGTTTIKVYKTGGTTKWISGKFYKSDGTTDITNGLTFLTATGDGTEKTATLKPGIKYDLSNPGCAQSGTIYTCEQGDYLRSIDIKATW